MGYVPPKSPLFPCDYCKQPIHYYVKHKELVDGLVSFYCSLRCKLLDKLKRSK